MHYYLFFLMINQLWSQILNQTHIVIEMFSDTSLTKDQILNRISLFDDDPVFKYLMSPLDTKVYVYAVIRDRYGNFVKFAENTSWSSLDTNKLSFEVNQLKPFECTVNRKKEFTGGQASIIADESITGNGSDTSVIEVIADGCFIRLIDSDLQKTIDTIRCFVGDSINLSVTRALIGLTTSYAKCSALWNIITDSVQFLYQIPAFKDSAWVCKPVSSGKWFTRNQSGRLYGSINSNYYYEKSNY
jgi:hypothetical protein